MIIHWCTQTHIFILFVVSSDSSLFIHLDSSILIHLSFWFILFVVSSGFLKSSLIISDLLGVLKQNPLFNPWVYIFFSFYCPSLKNISHQLILPSYFILELSIASSTKPEYMTFYPTKARNWIHNHQVTKCTSTNNLIHHAMCHVETNWQWWLGTLNWISFFWVHQWIIMVIPHLRNADKPTNEFITMCFRGQQMMQIFPDCRREIHSFYFFCKCFYFFCCCSCCCCWKRRWGRRRRRNFIKTNSYFRNLVHSEETQNKSSIHKVYIF